MITAPIWGNEDGKSTFASKKKKNNGTANFSLQLLNLSGAQNRLDTLKVEVTNGLIETMKAKINTLKAALKNTDDPKKQEDILKEIEKLKYAIELEVQRIIEESSEEARNKSKNPDSNKNMLFEISEDLNTENSNKENLSIEDFNELENLSKFNESAKVKIK